MKYLPRCAASGASTPGGPGASSRLSGAPNANHRTGIGCTERSAKAKPQNTNASAAHGSRLHQQMPLFRHVDAIGTLPQLPLYFFAHSRSHGAHRHRSGKSIGQQVAGLPQSTHGGG